MPQISVIIPSYNCARYLPEALESVFKQTYTSYEVIVVDDGSTDETRDLLRQYGEKIRYVYQKNRGLSSARNTGIRAAVGEFVALLDADDIWCHRKLEMQVTLLENSSSVGLVSCNDIAIDNYGRMTQGFHRSDYGSKKRLMKNLMIKNVVSGGSNALIRKTCFNEVGYFDEQLKSAEDWDMWIRIAKRYDIKVIQEPLVKIRVRSDSMSAPANADKMIRNALVVLEKGFHDYPWNRKILLKMKAYSDRYFCASWAFFNAGDRVRAREYIFRSFKANPIYFITTRSVVGLFIRIIMTSRE